ncbi:NADPH:quinone oxidoreductase family protein [Kiloniella antarctica]|uniref:NADPH:quinone oxidoreductase family protein n=1 Tax=Kiloniella antarctica TaxID=1550907 RepID=A0ABW5BPE0_9PROT
MKRWVSSNTLGIQGMKFIDESWAPSDPTKLVVRVHAAALNFSDLLMVEDKYQVRPPRPFTPGQEVAGVIVSAPKGSGWGIGDRVASKVIWGGFSELVEVRTDMAFRVPDNITFAKAAALPVAYITSMVAFFDSTKVQPEDTVLVHAAAGGVGLAAVEIAKAIGARVIATAGSDDKLDLAREHGADVGINYHDKNWFQTVKEVTDGKGVNVIYDPVGGDIGINSLRCIARDGILLVVGFASGVITKLPANRLMLKRASAKGVYWNHDYDGAMLGEMTRKLFLMLEKGQINPVVHEGQSLENLPDAMALLQSRKTTGKVILNIPE